VKVFLKVFGCTMNKVDAQLIESLAKAGGHEVVHSEDEADLIVINSCVVREESEKKALRYLERIKKCYNGKRVILTGCLPSALPELVRDTETVKLDELEKAFSKLFGVKEAKVEREVNSISHPVPIARGCLGNCSYCIVKLARGRLRSSPMDEVISEVERALSRGAKEILLTAEDTAAYGLDLGENLPSLLREMLSTIEEEEFRLRIGMMTPGLAKRIYRDLSEIYEDPRVYKFLHLPLQSGDDGILRKMRRNYSVKDYLEIVKHFRRKFPELNLATDIIVGFPGEGAEEFSRTLEALMKSEPDKVHVARYSPRPKTEAYEMKPPPGRVIKSRSRILHNLRMNLGLKRNSMLLGERFEVLLTSKGKKGGLIGRAPNYKQVILREGVLGEFSRVEVVGYTPTYLKGVRVE